MYDILFCVFEIGEKAYGIARILLPIYRVKTEAFDQLDVLEEKFIRKFPDLPKIEDVICEPEIFSIYPSMMVEEYFGIIIFFFISTILALIITGFSYFLINQEPELEKLTPYECGFEAYEAPRVQFDIKFCVVAILLIIFDVEMMYLFPWCVSVFKISVLGVWSMVDFIFELGFGYLYLIEKDSLEW